MTPEGWISTSLADLADYINGRAFKPTDWSVSGLPIIRIAQLTDPSAVPNRYDGPDIEAKHLVHDGDLLFSWSATLAVHRWLRGPAILNQHIFKVVATPGIDREFLRHLLQHAIPALGEESHGSTMKHIRKGVLETFRVALPPSPEQRKIAAILSSVDDAIEATQAVINQLGVVKKAMMAELLTRGLPGRHTRFKQTEIGEVPEEWEVKRVRDVGEVKLGRMKSPVYTAGAERPYLRVANVLDDSIDTSDVLTMPFEDEQYDAFRLRPGDILLNEGQSLDLVGRSAIYRGEPPDCAFQKTLLRFRASSTIDTEFAQCLFQFWLYSGRFAENAVQTTSIAHLTGVRFEAMKMALPPIDEQRAIAAAIVAFKDRAALERSSLLALEAMKSALSSVLLTGEVRVTPDPDPEPAP